MVVNLPNDFLLDLVACYSCIDLCCHPCKNLAGAKTAVRRRPTRPRTPCHACLAATARMFAASHLTVNMRRSCGVAVSLRIKNLGFWKHSSGCSGVGGRFVLVKDACCGHCGPTPRGPVHLDGSRKLPGDSRQPRPPDSKRAGGEPAAMSTRGSS